MIRLLMLVLVLASMPAADEGTWVYACVRAYTDHDPIDSRSGHHLVTATGVHTRDPSGWWGIAADPLIFPYGTRIQVPGYAPSVRHTGAERWPVDDTGAIARRWWRQDRAVLIEVRFRTRTAARAWGEQWLWVQVFNP